MYIPNPGEFLCRINMMPHPSFNPQPRRFPLLVKLAYSAFVSLHIWINWRVYGPLNFLWFCDLAVLATLVALWAENRLLLSITAVGILLPMSLWIVDLCARIVFGHYIFGYAAYMFSRRIPLSVRAVSTFHLWLPVLLVWMLFRRGYDRRALAIQWVVCLLVLLTSRLVSSPPPATSLNQAVNINWVYGSSDFGPQTAMPGWLYLGVMMALYPIVIYVPMHLVLTGLFSRQRAKIKNPLPIAEPEAHRMTASWRKITNRTSKAEYEALLGEPQSS